MSDTRCCRACRWWTDESKDGPARFWFGGTLREVRRCRCPLPALPMWARVRATDRLTREDDGGTCERFERMREQ